MPWSSIGSSVCSRSPAVSDKSTGRPPSCSVTSTTSRVVPAIGETIAAGRSASAFSSVDLPAFGGPRMATRTPSRTTSPRPPSPSCASTSDRRRRTFCIAPKSASVVTSSASSPKSMRASVCARAARSSWRHPSSLLRCAPPILRSACLRCSSVSALIRSASPSTCVSSMRPLANACRVNSPGSAIRRPSSLPSASSVAEITARDPCVCNSTVSSPVKELGPGNHSASTSSMSSRFSTSAFSGDHIFRRTAFRGTGGPPLRPGTMCENTSAARGPDIRTTETPARPAPEDRAKTVSAPADEGANDSATQASGSPTSVVAR
mmetsp:Transcript_73/g.230  ORF Transcript_73/g.230 Transcript_73/m.230 type:complete len:320 (-) Transcript_73:28-987(-)